METLFVSLFMEFSAGFRLQTSWRCARYPEVERLVNYASVSPRGARARDHHPGASVAAAGYNPTTHIMIA
jgi:hypothetical protein